MIEVARSAARSIRWRNDGHGGLEQVVGFYRDALLPHNFPVGRYLGAPWYDQGATITFAGSWVNRTTQWVPHIFPWLDAYRDNKGFTWHILTPNWISPGYDIVTSQGPRHVVTSFDLNDPGYIWAEGFFIWSFFFVVFLLLRGQFTGRIREFDAWAHLYAMQVSNDGVHWRDLPGSLKVYIEDDGSLSGVNYLYEDAVNVPCLGDISNWVLTLGHVGGQHIGPCSGLPGPPPPHRVLPCTFPGL